MRLLSTLIPIVSAIVIAAFPLDGRHSSTKRSISESLYDDLFWYYKYAISAYALNCPYPNGNTLIKQFSDSELGTDTQGFIARDDIRKEIVVSLRGSDTVTDFLTDWNQDLTTYVTPEVTPPSGTTVHKGYLAAWNSVVSGVMEQVQNQLTAYPGYSIITTGHSLGAALSSLAAVSMKAYFPDAAIRMYTYGQPRTGNDTYAFYVNDLFGPDAYRVTHTNDGIPLIIPTSLGYRHHGIEYWMSPDGPSAENTKECAADGEDPTCSVSTGPSQSINEAHLTYFGLVVIVDSFCNATTT